MPEDNGFWPAFWMFGGTRWNEIDVFDNSDGISKFVTNIQHDYDGDGTSEGCNHFYSGYDFSQWHTFTCIFDFDKTTWLIDDNPVRTQYRILTADGDPVLCGDNIGNGTYFQNKSFPLESMSIIFNLAIKSGSNTPTASKFPGSFEIDYVRFYKRVTLPPCETVSDELLVLPGGTFPQTLNYLPNHTIAVKNTIVTLGNVVPPQGQTWRAGESIELNPGFETLPGTTWTAEIGDCTELFGRLANSDTTFGKGKSDGTATDTLVSQPLYASVQNEKTADNSSVSIGNGISPAGNEQLASEKPSKKLFKQTEIDSVPSPIHITPNPSADGKFFLICSLQEVGCMNAEISVMNTLGQVIHQKEFTHYTFPVSIDLSSQPKGTFFVTIHPELKLYSIL